MYGSWYIKHDDQNFLSFWTVFCPFTPLPTWKIKILKNWKKCLEISSFYRSVPKIMTINHDHMLYCSWDMPCNTCNHYFLFWAIFCPFTSLTAQKIKIKKKMKKRSGDIIILYMHTKNYDQMMYGSWCTVPEICYATGGRTDEWTDRKSDI